MEAGAGQDTTQQAAPVPEVGGAADRRPRGGPRPSSVPQAVTGSWEQGSRTRRWAQREGRGERTNPALGHEGCGSSAEGLGGEWAPSPVLTVPWHCRSGCPGVPAPPVSPPTVRRVTPPTPALRGAGNTHSPGTVSATRDTGHSSWESSARSAAALVPGGLGPRLPRSTAPSVCSGLGRFSRDRCMTPITPCSDVRFPSTDVLFSASTAVTRAAGLQGSGFARTSGHLPAGLRRVRGRPSGLTCPGHGPQRLVPPTDSTFRPL